MGVLHRIVFSHTPDEARSGGLAKACVPGKNYSVLEKIEFLMNIKQNEKPTCFIFKEKYHFRCTSITFFGEVVSRDGMQLDLQKISALTEMPVPKNKKELQAFLGIINYLSKFSPDTSEVCKPLRKLMSSKAMWTWDPSYKQ